MAKQSKIENRKSKTLFEPGRYLSIPNVLLRSVGLTASAKLVWMALAGHLGPDGTEVWPSINRLAGMTGLERKTVIASVAALEAAGLILTIKTAGRATRYRILQPQAGLFAPAKTDVKNVPVRKTYQSQKRTGTKNGLRPVPKTDSNYLSEVLKENTPPNPPQVPQGMLRTGGSGGGDFSSSKKTKTKEEIIRQIDTAHAKTFGKPLPAKWKRDVRLEYDDGDRASLERIDADVLREAEKYRAVKKWNCLSHATVMQYLAHLDRQAQAKRQGDANTKAQADAKAKADAEADAEVRRQQAEAMKFFQSLPVDDQERFIARVRDRPFAPVERPDLLNLQAASMAFGEKTSAVTV